MRPASPASYALVLLVGLCATLLAARLVELVTARGVDPALTVAIQSAITATLGALVYVVHRNGSKRP